MQDKSDLRRPLIAARQAVEAGLRAQWDAAIGRRIGAWLAQHPLRSLGVYWPIRAEPDLRGFYAEWAAAGVQLALPVVIDKDAPLRFLAWTEDGPLARDAMGVMVPHAGSPEVHPDAILVPCVGYNEDRIRLGYGGGFYDRTLAPATGTSMPRPQALGVAYSCSRVEFAAAAHDVALDLIFTELGSA